MILLQRIVLTVWVQLDPPSSNVTLETELDFWRLAPKQRVKDVVSTVDGPFCYAYV